MGIEGKNWIRKDEKELKLEAIKIMLEIKKEEYQIGTLRKEDYDRQLCELSMAIRNMGII